MTEREWILLSLYLTSQADDNQKKQVLEWCDATPQNRLIFEDTQYIFNQKHLHVPAFDCITAFKKLDKKIKS